MKIYIVLIKDRHTDPEIKVFTTLEKAITYARELANSYADKESEYPMEYKAGNYYFWDYSESDYIRVEENQIE